MGDIRIDVEGLSVTVDAEEYAKDPVKVYDDVLKARQALRLPENHPVGEPYQDLPEDVE